MKATIFCATIFIGLLAVWAMGCGDDKSTNSSSSGSDSAVEAKIKQLLDDPGYPAKKKMRVTVSDGFEPEISWNQGIASQVKVYELEPFLQTDIGSFSIGGENWKVSCRNFNCLSSPMTYGNLRNPDCCIGDSYSRGLDTATEYVVFVTRDESTQRLWGYTTFTTPAER